jgi:hypothetical protein
MSGCDTTPNFHLQDNPLHFGTFEIGPGVNYVGIFFVHRGKSPGALPKTNVRVQYEY